MSCHALIRVYRLVWGDKHNVTLMSSLQVLQNKVAKIILDQLLYSSAPHALATLRWIPLETIRFQRGCAGACLQMSKWTYKSRIDFRNTAILSPQIKSILGRLLLVRTGRPDQFFCEENFTTNKNCPAKSVYFYTVRIALIGFIAKTLGRGSFCFKNGRFGWPVLTFGKRP